ncbi:MAG: TRAP transporter large permease subunit, partial [Pseudomonadota bacterium]
MTRENHSGGEGNRKMDHGTKDSTPRRLMRLVITIIAVAMSLYHLVYVSGLFIRLGIPIMAVPHRAASLGFTVLLIFLLYPATKKFLVFDAVLSLGCVAACGYYVINFDQVIVDITRYGAATPTELVFALFMIIGIFEAARRVIGLAMPLIMACFFLYTLFSNHFPGILRGTGAGLDRAAAFVLLSPEGLFGLPMAVGATIIIMFVLFGQFLNSSGGGKFFIDLSSSLFGHFRGGPAKVSVVASALFGSINGSTAA